MSIELVISFILASLLLIIMPGPDNIFVVTESATKGKKEGILISIGLSCGILIHTLAATTGISFIIQNSAIAFTIIKYIGAAYLLYLAYMSSKEKTDKTIIDQNSTKTLSPLKLIRKGLLMNILNPKVSLFFIAFFPQFITQNGLHSGTQMLILGTIFMIMSTIIFSLVATLASNLTPHLQNPKFWKYTKIGKVSVLGTLGILLALSKK
jgi:threonine/homoserine/homoserine lactone efflux protein